MLRSAAEEAAFTMPKHPKRRTRRNLAVLALSALCLTGFLYWDNTALQVTRFDPVFSDLPAGFDSCRIVVLSDLHGASFGAHNADLLAAVAAEQPEYIFFLGDLEDKYRGPEDGYPAETARGLSAIAPTYYVTGNHEWAVGGVPALKEILTANGVTVLSNQFVPLERNGDTIVLAGIDDPNGYAGQKSPEEVAGEVKEAAGDGFWLLMAHRNNLFDGEYCRLGADLVLSGHGHGGIWRLPFTDGLLGAGGQLLPSFTNGFYRCTDGHEAQVFVTRGLGGIPRLFNHPQVAVLTLHCE